MYLDSRKNNSAICVLQARQHSFNHALGILSIFCLVSGKGVQDEYLHRDKAHNTGDFCKNGAHAMFLCYPSVLQEGDNGDYCSFEYRAVLVILLWRSFVRPRQRYSRFNE